MRIWITTVGWSTFAVINPLWAACFYQYFIPEKVILLNNGEQDNTIKNNLEIVKTWQNRILIEYGIEKPIIEAIAADEDDVAGFADMFKKIIKKYKQHELAIDMTPGRKFMSSIAMSSAIKNKSFVKKLYYLHLWGIAYQNQPFIKIPFKNQKLIDILELL